jgi:hypothetical protein
MTQTHRTGLHFMLQALGRHAELASHAVNGGRGGRAGLRAISNQIADVLIPSGLAGRRAI